MTQTEIREQKRNWDTIHAAFCWSQLSKDFMRELVGKNWMYRWKLEHELLMDFHGYSCHASAFYHNMYQYIKSGLATDNQLRYYTDRTYMMYREQLQKQCNSRETVKLIDFNGKVLDMVQI